MTTNIYLMMYHFYSAFHAHRPISSGEKIKNKTPPFQTPPGDKMRLKQSFTLAHRVTVIAFHLQLKSDQRNHVL